MSEKDKIKKELENLSPFLSKMKEQEEQPFQVPPNFFQSMQDEVLRQINLEPETSKDKAPSPSWLDQLANQIQWLLQPRYAMAMATVAILVVAGIFFLQPGNVSSTQVAVTDLTEDDITAYIASNIEDFDADQLVEIMPEEEGASILPTPTLEESELEDYLKDIIDEIDLEELEELL